MDAMEFIRERNRMCKAFPRCKGCPACDFDGRGSVHLNEGIIPIVEKWAKEHPRKTRQSVFLEQYPEAAIDADGVLKVCPAPISHAHRRHDGFCANPERKCSYCRKEFWGQEVE